MKHEDKLYYIPAVKHWLPGWDIQERFHHEYGGIVYQPLVPEIDKFIEPYTDIRQAIAFLEGVRAATEQQDSKP